MTLSRPPIHPGEILGEELEEAGITASELARQINIPPSRLSKIINGKQAVTGDTTLRLGHWFGMSAQFWLNLQSAYDLRLAEQTAGPEIDGLPVRSATPPPPKAMSDEVEPPSLRAKRSNLLLR